MPSVDWAKIPLRAGPGVYHVVVETPRGADVKLKYEPELGAFVWSRPLVLGLRYPFDWGFFPRTRAPDGDPLDAMIVADVSTFPGVVVPCRPLAVLEVEQKRKDKPGRERNDRVLVVPAKAPRQSEPLSARIKDELEQFFLQAVAFEGKELAILGWKGAKEATSLIERSSRKIRR